jgi:hypothetical protein
MSAASSEPILWPIFDLGTADDLVHHQAARGAKPVARIRRDRNPEQRRLRRIAREWTHHKRNHAFKTVALHDDDGARFSGIVACASNGPYFASSHPLGQAEIESTKT